MAVGAESLCGESNPKEMRRDPPEVGNWPRLSLGPRWDEKGSCAVMQGSWCLKQEEQKEGKEGVQTGCQGQWDGAGMCTGQRLQRKC